MTKYVIVTAISSYRMRYCIPVDELQKLNQDVPIDGHEIEWAADCVTSDEVAEFSQLHLGEQIIDAEIHTEEQMLSKFAADYGWTEEQKIAFIRSWKCSR